MDHSLMEALRPEVQADLYSFYDQLRSADGLFWDKKIRAWVVTGYELAARAVNDDGLSSVRYLDLDAVPEAIQPVARVFARQMIYIDPPDHSRIRSVVRAMFTPKVVEMMRSQIVATVDELLAAPIANGKMELISEFAYPLPVGVISDLLGIERDDHGSIRQWSGNIAVVMSNALPSRTDVETAVASLDALSAHLQELVDGRSPSEHSPLLQELLHAEANGTLNRDELLANLVLFVIAGHETTTNLIGNGMLALLSHPEQMQRLADDPTIVKSAIEELLRFDSPVQVLLRRAKADMVLGGRDIEAGATVLVLSGAANRDPAAFVESNTLDVNRMGPRHLGFGHGAHACLGISLARLEAEIAFHALITRLSNITLDHPEPSWRRTFSFRGLTELPINFR